MEATSSPRSPVRSPKRKLRRTIKYGNETYETLYQGVLWKKTRSKYLSLFSRQNWKRRYFALLKPRTGNTETELLYFKLENSEPSCRVPKGTFTVTDLSVVKGVCTKNYLHCIEIINESETFHLRANSEIEKSKLINILNDLVETLQFEKPSTNFSVATPPLVPTNRNKGQKETLLYTLGVCICAALTAHKVYPSKQLTIAALVVVLFMPYVLNIYIKHSKGKSQDTPFSTNGRPSSTSSKQRKEKPAEANCDERIAKLKRAIISTGGERLSKPLKDSVEKSKEFEEHLGQIVRFFGDFFERDISAAVDQFHGFAAYMTNPVKQERLLEKVTPEFVETFMANSGIVMLGKQSRTLGGKRLLLTRPEKLQNVSINDLILFSVFFLVYTSADEDWGRNGFFVVHDLEEFSIRHAYRLKAVEWKKYSPANCFPMRMLGIVVINQPKWIEWLWSVACQLLPSKLQKRVTLLESTDSLYGIVEKSALPEFFGGTNLSTEEEFLDELRATWGSKFESVRPFIN